MTPVDTIAVLSAVPDTIYGDHSKWYVTSLRSIFRLERSSAATADGITIITTLSGTGRFIRENIIAPEWATQATWFVDPVNGNDEFDGTSSSISGTVGPIKTCNELARRLQDATINQVTTINLLGDILESNSDALRLRLQFGKSGYVLVKGSRTSVTTGTINTATAPNRASNIAWHITDSGVVSWASFQNKRIRITSGARSGAFAWIAADIGGGVAVTTPFITCSDAQGTTGLPTIVTPLNGDPYVIETVSRLDKVSIELAQELDISANTNFSIMCIEDVDTIQYTNGVQSVNFSTGAIAALGVLFLGCVTSLVGSSGVVHQVGCRSPGFGGYSNITKLFATLITGRFTVASGGTVFVDYDTLSFGSASDGVRVRLGGSLIVGTWGIFNAVNDGIRLEDGFVSNTVLNSGTVAIYGSGSNGYGAHIFPGPGGEIQADAIAGLTITGTLGDTLIGGTPKPWSETPYTEVNGASVAVRI